jgi:branched-chain amino acid transport system permease protein
MVAFVEAVAGVDSKHLDLPGWVTDGVQFGDAQISMSVIMTIVAAILVWLGIEAFLRRSRYGLIVRAGTENRDMVAALGINVERAFTVVFALGGAAAGLAGVVAGIYFRAISPGLGDSQMIFAFAVVIIGGLGSLTGSLVAAMVIGLVQQFGNYYVAPGAGDLLTSALLAVVLLVRPKGLFGKVAP